MRKNKYHWLASPWPIPQKVGQSTLVPAIAMSHCFDVRWSELKSNEGYLRRQGWPIRSRRDSRVHYDSQVHWAGRNQLLRNFEQLLMKKVLHLWDPRVWLDSDGGIESPVWYPISNKWSLSSYINSKNRGLTRSRRFARGCLLRYSVTFPFSIHGETKEILPYVSSTWYIP